MAQETITITSGSIETGNVDIKITIEGESNMPIWNHDLKVKAILTLLNDIDMKHYYEDDKADEGYNSLEKIVEAAKATFGPEFF